MNIVSVAVTPFAGQRPGTSGLRKKVAASCEPGYVEAFVQSLFDVLLEVVGHGVAGQTRVLGGDGRFFNPGGPDGDFGIKYNAANGGPAPERVTEAIYRRSQTIGAYKTTEVGLVPLGKIASIEIGGTELSVTDPVADYAALMDRIFDFGRLRALFHGGFRLCFDACMR